MNIQYRRTLEQQERRVRAIFVSSYIPRKCGIATFTKDLTNAINTLNPYNLAEIMAINNDNYDYPWEVKYRIAQDDLKTYIAAAEYINNSSAEIVCLQHEFGLFGGKVGEYVIPFLEHIKKPIVSTLHTVPENPNDTQKELIRRLSSLSVAVVVMIDSIVVRLVSTYGIEKKKIVVIPHGVPDIAYGGTEGFKKLLRLKGKFILSSINLISENKGIEYAIAAVPKLVEAIPNFIYLIIGVTHPVVKRESNEDYRHSLERLVKKLKIQSYVRFINRYLSLEDLIKYLRATDTYTTPYLDPEQVASGTLSYAVGAGKACVSTPYLYAKEVLGEERGVLIPFKNSEALAKAIIKLQSDPKIKSQIERKAYSYGRTMTWAAVGLQYLDLFKLVVRKAEVPILK